MVERHDVGRDGTEGDDGRDVIEGDGADAATHRGSLVSMYILSKSTHCCHSDLGNSYNLLSFKLCHHIFINIGV